MLERVVAAGVLIVATCGAGHAGPLAYGDPTLPTPLAAPPAAGVAAGGAAGTPGPAEAPRWRITSSLVSGERRVAVINGRSVVPGATIDGARLLAVDGRGAWLEHRGKRLRLDLPGGADHRIKAKTPTGE